MYDDDSEDEEEELYHCDVRNNNNKVKTLQESEEFTEKEHEQKHFDFLIDECVCNNVYNVCLCGLINEENNILQEEVRENAKHWKDKFFMEKG